MPHISAVNAAIQPPIQPGAAIIYGQMTGQPQGGQSLFTRVVGAQSTEVGNYYGKIVVPAGSALLIQLQGPAASGVQAEVALGWWEDMV